MRFDSKDWDNKVRRLQRAEKALGEARAIVDTGSRRSTSIGRVVDGPSARVARVVGFQARNVEDCLTAMQTLFAEVTVLLQKAGKLP